MRGSQAGGQAAAAAEATSPVAEAPAQFGDRMARAIKIINDFKVRLRLKPELLSSVIAVLHGVIGNNIEVREARRSIQKLLQVKSAALCSCSFARAMSPLHRAGEGNSSVSTRAHALTLVHASHVRALTQDECNSDLLAEALLFLPLPGGGDDDQEQDVVFSDHCGRGEDWGGGSNGDDEMHPSEGGGGGAEDGRRFQRRPFSKQEIINLEKGVKRYVLVL